MNISSIARDTPICICKWIDEIKDARLSGVVQDFGNEAHIYTHLIQSKDGLVDVLDSWRQRSSNHQKFILISHGIMSSDGRGIGAGRDGEEGDFIEWDELWDCLVPHKNKPPEIALIGCNTSNAINTWSPMLTNRMNNPPVLGVNEEVISRDLPSVRRLLQELVNNATSMSEIKLADVEVQENKSTFPKVELWYPTKVPGKRIFYCEAGQMQEKTSMSFSNFLDYNNKQLEDRVIKAANQRKLKKTE